MRSILKSAASVIGGEAAVRLANYAVVLFIARCYGASTLGAYAVTLSVATVVVMFADAGLQTAAVTRLSAETSHRNHVFGQLTFCKTALLIVAAFVLVAYGAIVRPGHLFYAIGAWLILRTVIQSLSQLQMAALKSVSKASLIGVIQLVHSAILFLGLSLAHHFTWAVTSLLAWLTAAQFLEFVVAVSALGQSGVYPRWPRSLELPAILKIAAPFGVVYGLANLIMRSDTIVLSKVVSLPELGAFSAANSLLLLVYVASWLFGSVLLPEMVRLTQQPDSLRKWTHLWARRAALTSLPVTLGVWFLAPRIIIALFGPAYTSSGKLASLMFLACPLILLNSIYTTFHIATNSRVLLVSVYAATAVAALVLDFILSRTAGSLGVAMAIVVREAAMLLAFRLFSLRVFAAAPRLEFRASSEGNWRA